MLTSEPPGTADLSLFHDYVHTGPSCTHPVCSPGVWSNAWHLLLPYPSSWARSLGKEPCTWPGDNTVAENHHPTQTITQFIPGIKTSISGVDYANSGRNPNWRVQLPLEKDIVFASVCKPGTSDPQVLHQAQVLDLVSHQHVVEASCRRQTGSSSVAGSRLQIVTPADMRRACRASPGCLASLGLMQRTYHGSLDIRISVKPTRLLLNWVTTWRRENRRGVCRCL